MFLPEAYSSALEEVFDPWLGWDQPTLAKTEGQQIPLARGDKKLWKHRN